MGGVTVSQGTADIASRSIEALGGTLDFTTDEPDHERKFTAALDLGSDDGQRFYLRMDTGHLFDREIRAWVSAVRQESRDWIQGFARSERSHLAGKVQAVAGRVDLSSYFSYDDTDNASYQRLTSDAEYRSDPRWDRLIDTWTGTPWINQLFRLGWSIPRKNTFGYLKADFAATDVLSITGGAYYHRQWGRGDWLPPYLVDVAADGGGPESELASGFTARGGAPLGQVQFVDPDGVPLTPRAGCVSSLQFPYGGAGPEFDPACHPAEAIPVQSYRHSHYGKERVGLTLDGDWFGELAMGGNRLRAGLWAEDGRRDLGRDWHKVQDVRVSHRYDDTPYWRQYDWEFPQSIIKWYVEDTLFAGPLAINAGVRQYLVEVGRKDHFGETAELSVSSDSDLLLSGGLTYTSPIDGLELFAGYAQNFKSLSDRLLEVPGRSLEGLEPETADNLDVGFRYSGDRLAATATYYRIDFQNRIFFLSPQTAAGPNYLIAGGGSYFNAGGIDSRGVEGGGGCPRPSGSPSPPRSTAPGPGTMRPTSAPTIRWFRPRRASGRGVRSSEFRAPWWCSPPITAGSRSPPASPRSTRGRGASPWTARGARTPTGWWTPTSAGRRGASGPRLQGLEVALIGNNLLDRPYLATISGQGAFLGAPRIVSLNVTASF